MDAEEQNEIDALLHEIDGTDNFSNIGGNTVFAISVANAEAAATSYDLPLFQHLSGYLANELPYPLGNVLGGGKHALGKTTDIQEYLVIPFNASCFAEAAKANIMVHNKIGALLRKADPNFTGGRGDEGAWAPNIENEDALKIVVKACDAVSAELEIECRHVLMLLLPVFVTERRCLRLFDGRNQAGFWRAAGVYVACHRGCMILLMLRTLSHEDDYESFAELTKKVRIVLSAATTCSSPKIR